MFACVILIGLLDHFFLYPPLGDLFAWFGNITLGTAALGIACFHARRAAANVRGNLTRFEKPHTFRQQ
jgi:hypothetical protein